MKNYILSLDQGTTSSRSILYDTEAQVINIENKEIKQYFPQNGWVEHDPEEIWTSQLYTAKRVLSKLNTDIGKVEAIGVTNQRETTVVWNRKTGKPLYNAIVWQDRRTADYCFKLKKEGFEEMVSDKTGLTLDAYFSASKIKWILDNVEGARKMADNNELAFGSVDSWLVWKLSNGKHHITDLSNASRTLLLNIHTHKWDDDLLKLFDIPASMLPEIVDSSGLLSETDSSIFGHSIPITGIAGDQQAALFGQLCLEKGMIKCTYGTGCFTMLNTGDEVIRSTSNLLSTIAWRIKGKVTYALEGSVFIGGAVIQWLRDELEFFKEASDSESLAEAADDNGGVFFVPALAGLGAPHWDPFARGSIFGITRSTNKSHLTRAALESICYQVNDILNAKELDFPLSLEELRVDGGAAGNSLLLQFQSDISQVRIKKAASLETTALGAAYLAGLGSGMWSKDDLSLLRGVEVSYLPAMKESKRVDLLDKWDKAINRSKNWES